MPRSGWPVRARSSAQYSSLTGGFFFLMKNERPSLSRSHSTALVVELVDTQDLKSCGQQWPYRFKSDPGHKRRKRKRAECAYSFSFPFSFSFSKNVLVFYLPTQTLILIIDRFLCLQPICIVLVSPDQVIGIIDRNCDLLDHFSIF